VNIDIEWMFLLLIDQYWWIGEYWYSVFLLTECSYCLLINIGELMNIDIVCFYWLNVCTVYWPLLVNFSKRSWLSFILVVNKWPTQSEQTQQCCHQHQPLMHRPIGQIHPHYRNVGRGWEWALRVSNLHTVPKPQCTVSEILSKLLNVRQELNIAPAKHQVPDLCLLLVTVAVSTCNTTKQVTWRILPLAVLYWHLLIYWCSLDVSTHYYLTTFFVPVLRIFVSLTKNVILYHCQQFQYLQLFSHNIAVNNNNYYYNCNTSKTMFMVLSSWQSHCESSPGSFDECRTAPSGRQPLDQARRLRLWVRLYRLPESTPTIAVYYYYLVWKLILILPSHRG